MSPSEANSSSPNQEIPQILWNLKIHDRVHNSVPLALTLSQINPVHSVRFYFFKTHFNIILPYTPWFPTRYSFPIKPPYTFRPNACYMLRQYNPPWSDHP